MSSRTYPARSNTQSHNFDPSPALNPQAHHPVTPPTRRRHENRDGSTPRTRPDAQPPPPSTPQQDQHRPHTRSADAGRTPPANPRQRPRMQPPRQPNSSTHRATTGSPKQPHTRQTPPTI